MVMELLEGETLTERWVRSGPTVPTQDVLAFMYAALDVLAAAHAQGVLHRDLKPDNLFITQDGQLRVLDFGLGRLPNDPEMTLARPGALLGTPGFMSPEQTRSDWARVDHRTDIWAIGAIMYVLLSGQAVHGAPTSVESVVAAMNESPRPLASRAPHVPREVAEIVDRALAVEPEQRWQSAADMRRAVRDAYWAHIARSRRAIATEQRRHKRFPIGIAAAIESVDENTIGVVVDGSKSGVLLRTTSRFHVGQKLVVDFRFPGDSKRRRLSGWVTRTAEQAHDTSPFRRLVAIGFDSHYSLLTHDPKPKNETQERPCESR